MKSTLDALIARIGIDDDALMPCGRDIVKIDADRIGGDEKGRVVLVTAMTPTPAGEGKTTTSIGLTDALCRLGVRAVGALREPSLGPLFGKKGGAVGGGLSKVGPADRINLHFTGDIHAVSSAHNLLSAMLDNHMFQDLAPVVDPGAVTWGRTLDMNDRALRTVEIGRATKKGPVRTDRFDITAASEVMAILCMSRDVEDLKARLARIVVGRTGDGKTVTAGDLKAVGAMAAILLDATKPNLVQTLEGNAVFMHGGPFANIAQGTSSIRQTKLARRLADVVVTEGGFAFDLGGYKFLDLKCRAGEFRPAAVVLVVTVRALRHHGGVDFAKGPDVDAVKRGLANVAAHLEAMQRLGLPQPLVSVNRFPDDSQEELAVIEKTVRELGGKIAFGTYFAEGGKGGEGLARLVMDQLSGTTADSPNLQIPYVLDDGIATKVEKVAKVVLGASGVALTDKAKADLAAIESMGFGKLPICLAKTHLSISDDANVLGKPAPFTLKVTGFRVSAGAGFVVALCGPILTMPGLPEVPAAYGVDVVRQSDGGYEIVGLK